MESRCLDVGEPLLAERLDRLVAQRLAARRHRLLLIDKLDEAAFAQWARGKAMREPEAVAYLDLLADGRSLVTGCIIGLDVSGDDLDDALEVVLTGRSVVLVTGLERARARLGERLFRWLDWCATHVPLTVAITGDPTAYVMRLRHHEIAVEERLESCLEAATPAVAGSADPPSREVS